MSRQLVRSFSVAAAATAMFLVTDVRAQFLDVSASGGGQITDVRGTCAPVAAAAVSANPALSGGITCDLTLDSVADILVIDANVQSNSGLIFGDVDPAHTPSPHSPPPDALIAIFPELAAHSYVTTPGVTSSAADLVSGASELESTRDYTVFDTTDDGPQSDFQWARFTFVPSEAMQGSATFSASIQTVSVPTPVFDEIEGVFGFPLTPEQTFGNVLASITDASEFSADYGSHPSVTAADDPATYANGVSMFVPSNTALADFDGDLNVNDLLVDGALSFSDFESMVPNVGDTTLLTAISGSQVTLENGSLLYGGAAIVDSLDTENGWIHIVDGIPSPVPEPRTLSLLALAMAGLSSLRKRRSQ